MTTSAIIQSIKMEFGFALSKSDLDTLNQLNFKQAENLYERLSEEFA